MHRYGIATVVRHGGLELGLVGCKVAKRCQIRATLCATTGPMGVANVLSGRGKILHKIEGYEIQYEIPTGLPRRFATSVAKQG